MLAFAPVILSFLVLAAMWDAQDACTFDSLAETQHR